MGRAGDRSGRHVDDPSRHRGSLPTGQVTLVWAFGRSKDGIDFAAYDNQPARFLLLFLVPDNAYQQNLQTLAGLARFFRGDQVLRDLATAPDATAILNIIRGGLNYNMELRWDGVPPPL